VLDAMRATTIAWSLVFLAEVTGCDVGPKRVAPEADSGSEPIPLVVVACESPACTASLAELRCPGIEVIDPASARHVALRDRRPLLRLRLELGKGEGVSGPYDEGTAHLDEMVCSIWTPRERMTLSSDTIDARVWVCETLATSVPRLRKAGYVEPVGCVG
jgi:hypothetical protein